MLGKKVVVCAWKKVVTLEKSGRAWKIMVIFLAGPSGPSRTTKKPPINNNFSALKGHPSGNTASEYRTYRLALGKKWSCLEKSGRAWKKVVVLGKKWSCLEKSGHFLEKNGIDVVNVW